MENFNINPLHLEDIQNPEHPSIFFESDDYSILIYRLFTSKKENLNVISNPFLLYKDEIYKYDIEKKEFIKLNNFTVLST